MTKLLSATYRDGVLRPSEPLALPEGAAVRIAIIDADDQRAWDAGAAAAAARSIAAMPSATDTGTEHVGRDHDRYLYGAGSRPGREG